MSMFHNLISKLFYLNTLSFILYLLNSYNIFIALYFVINYNNEIYPHTFFYGNILLIVLWINKF